MDKERWTKREPARQEYTLITQETAVLSPLIEGIPAMLAERPQWVCWRLVERKGKKPTKVPYVADTDELASSTNLMTWRRFETAVAAYQTDRYHGLGFMICCADPFVFVDLDECRDRESGKLAPWARRIVDSLEGSYVEVSPSGEGVHILTRAVLKVGVNTKSIEVYGQDRFATITGRSP
jgi:putative DNA primase/helicase